jgi:hypothetical protein
MKNSPANSPAKTANQHQLYQLAREINHREKTLQEHRHKTVNAASEWMCEVVLQGYALLKAKASMPHGMWSEWLRIQCPLVTQWTANAYMRVAANWGQVKKLDEAMSLRAALALCTAEPNDVADGNTKSFPPFLEAISRIGKLTAYIAKHPLGEWPAEGREKLREMIRPIAQELGLTA